ncbi:hypothetical protein BGZ70_005639 [Mortierella alpina]|uniref:Uncharacterized protein n=1 Tax=Mortierella alpina TaxID=64518 RepID=A0A9P6M4B1_MORAP|nr:hypothetical protein BGZ70_005639 [Mortierella alpina]
MSVPDKARRQLDSVFTINKAECEKSYRHEISGLKVVEDERRSCLRQRDDVVTVKYRLEKDRVLLLEQTRQLKKLNDTVFDRSRDEVANTDFPEELYWQLELKEYDIKISALRQQVMKYKTALSNLARAANLSEAALMALLGYPDAAYKVWRVEYALQASQKMRLYLRVELSLSNAYSHQDVAREACPSIVPSLTTPVKPSTVQGHFEAVTKNARGRYKIQPFTAEHELRSYIAQLRAAHKNAELVLAQETERLQSMEAYRESIVPLLAKIRRHVFQNSCMAGLRIEGWEDDQGRSLLGTEADLLVRGGIHEIVPPTMGRLSHSSTSPQMVPGSRRASDDFLDQDEETLNTGHNRERRSSARLSDNEDQDASVDSNNPVIVHDGRVVLEAGRAPFSTISPANMLGSEVLMEVDRQRQAVRDHQTRRDDRRRSHSRSGLDSERGSGPDGQQGQDSNELSALGSLMLSNGPADQGSGGQGQGEREGRKKISRGLFGFGRTRRGSHNDDAVVPLGSSSDTASPFQLPGRNSRSSMDVTSINTDGSSLPSSNASNGHRSNVPSISISREDEDGLTQHPLRRTLFENASLAQLPLSSSSSSSPGSVTPLSSPGSRPRVMSMDEYVGVGPVAERDESFARSFEHAQGSGPLIPSYEEHQMHQVIDPESAFMMGLTSLAESDEDAASGMTNGLRIPGHSTMGVHRQISSSGQQGTRARSRSLSPHPLFSFGALTEDNYRRTNSNMAGPGTGSGTGPAPRAPYQQHQYSFSDQTPDGSALSRVAPPPDYAMQPPQYTA